MKKLELEIIKKAMEHCKQTIFHVDQGYPLGYVAVDILQEEVRLAFTAGIEAALSVKPKMKDEWEDENFLHFEAEFNSGVNAYENAIKSLLKE